MRRSPGDAGRRFMYEQFFGLGDLPFRLTPDPKYLFMSAKHREAFAHLVYGIREGSGFVAITGEVGAGKTTLIRALLADNAEGVTVASIVNPVLTSTELLQTINAELGLPSRSTSRKELLEELAAFLERNRDEGRRTVIIVDEAQNLDPVVLEQLRLLSNLETETEKLLQVVLVGQPELQGLLQRHDLRQLNQRVTERWHLDKLDHDEAFEYVRHRLRVAGAQGDLIDAKGLEVMYRYTAGVPRLLNILGHRALLVAYTRSRGRAGAEEVSTAARELGYATQVASDGGRRWRSAAGVAAAAVVAAAVAFLLLSPVAEEVPRPKGPAAAPPTAAASPAAGATTESDPSASLQESATGAAVAAAANDLASASEDIEAAPAAEEPAIDDAAAFAALARRPVYDGAVEDYSALLELWDAAAVDERDLLGDALRLEVIAASRGLRYVAVELNVALLGALDLPALVEMRLPGEGELRYVLLRSLDPDRAAAVVGDGLALTLAGLETAWNRRAHLVWKDPDGLRFDLGPGSGGPSVQRLQSMLAEIGAMDSQATGLYDDLTENAVRRFQHGEHIAVDGVAGPITQILLYNSLGRVTRPTLGSGGAAERPGQRLS